MKTSLAISGAGLVAAALARPSFAADKYVIDPEHVSVNFSMQHSKWAKYQGTIRKIAGVILFDKEDPENGSVRVEMAAKSVDTLDEGRDLELQGYGFLLASKNP